jgi:hypothetical protein
LPPPPTFDEFEFSFDPSLSHLFPQAPPLPHSADLFSVSETTDLLGFFDTFNWDIDGSGFPGDSAFGNMPPPFADFDELANPPTPSAGILPPYSNPHLDTAPERSASTKVKSDLDITMDTDLGPSRESSAGAKRTTRKQSRSEATKPPPPPPIMVAEPAYRQLTPPPTPISPEHAQQQQQEQHQQKSQSQSRPPKPLLSTPQKRLNHILSEQKRRNAIRDGYAKLITLLAPACGTGAAPLAMPSRGRPKGSGGGGKNSAASGGGKGKSGVLFRAVEYIRWLEENTKALEVEVDRAEMLAGVGGGEMKFLGES